MNLKAISSLSNALFWVRYAKIAGVLLNPLENLEKKDKKSRFCVLRPFSSLRK